MSEAESATPEPARRPRSREEFCKLFRVGEPDLVSFEIDSRFETAVLECKKPMIRAIPRVLESVIINATDRSRTDQWEWIERFYKLAGVDIDNSRTLPGAGEFDL